MDILLDIVHKHKSGSGSGIYSICSAHPIVLEAALLEGLASGAPVLIEATSNQVNQFGGYTGMTPHDFHEFVMAIADKVDFPRERVLLGGDHLGPNCWQTEKAEQAMLKSEVLIEQYIAAGFRKIHLDCSMSCADDPVPLSGATVAQRAVRLCAVAERAWRTVGGEAPVYVIGTEVPVPGGAREELHALEVTRAAAANETIEVHRAAFIGAGLALAWLRVVGLVVQPGVEFDHDKVIDYCSSQAKELSSFIESDPVLVYEAHSTDYQTSANLKALVRDHYAILKVGPGASFALRETLWALADIEAAWLGSHHSSNLKEVVLKVMRDEPKHWRNYYCEFARHEFDMQFSLSDRMRYYWPHPEVQRACATMLTNLDKSPPPLTLLSQYLPYQYAAIRAGNLRLETSEILLEGVAMVLRQYRNACSPTEYELEKNVR